MLDGDPSAGVEQAPSSAQLARLVRAVQDLSRARSLPDVQRVVGAAARDLASADGATFVLRDGDQVHYAEEDAIGPLWKGRRFAIDECISGWSMKHGSPVVIEDVRLDDRIPQDAYRPTFVRSLVMVPIRPERAARRHRHLLGSAAQAFAGDRRGCAGARRLDRDRDGARSTADRPRGAGRRADEGSVEAAWLSSCCARVSGGSSRRRRCTPRSGSGRSSPSSSTTTPCSTSWRRARNWPRRPRETPAPWIAPVRASTRPTKACGPWRRTSRPSPCSPRASTSWSARS